jgi:hypoxanthine-DNA glycosylase
LTELLRGLPPLIDARARVLILGSFPSAASLAAQQYYAHRQNQFWRILGAILDSPLVGMGYTARAETVKSAGIAIWDVYAECSREGSLDSAIREAAPNDFRSLKMLAPDLRRVCCNGKSAAKAAPVLVAMGYGIDILPSTSPAYTLAFERKLGLWSAALAEH